MPYDNEREPLLSSLHRGSVFQTPGIKDEEEDYLAASSIGERLPYSSYTSIGMPDCSLKLMVDWLHEVVKASAREKHIENLVGIRGSLVRFWDKVQGWVAVALIGFLTAVVAFLVDIAQATVFDWKLGSLPRFSRTDFRLLSRKMVASTVILLSWRN